MQRSPPLLLLAATAAFAQWPPPTSASDAYRYLEARRSAAEKLWTQRDPKGLELLNDILAYLDQPLVRELAGGNFYLASRRPNLYIDFAEAYALQGRNAESVAYLRKALDYGASAGFADALEKDANLAGLRSDRAFGDLIDRERRLETFWDAPALQTPFRENLPDAEKVAGLSKFWSEVKYNFAYPEKLAVLDWDRLYIEAIPKVLATTSTADYYRELMRLCARIGDGHTNVYFPDALHIAKPPLRTNLIEGRVLILDSPNPALEAQGLRAGAEILEVDGAPVLDYARREVEPFESASTEQDLQNRTYWYGFLRGPESKPVHLKLRDFAGAEFERDVARQGYRGARRTLPLDWRMLDGNIAYVALNTFESNDVIKLWSAALPKISTAAAIVLDVRLNGGGDSRIGDAILQTLIAKPIPASRALIRIHSPTAWAVGDEVVAFREFPATNIEPSSGTRYSGPVVVLSGPATYSAAEDFLVAWKNSGRGKTIGEPSGGSTGQPLNFQLPGGGLGRVCTKRDTFPNGTVWVGKGIEPDILVRPTVADVRAGRDAVLERAIEFLKLNR